METKTLQQKVNEFEYSPFIYTYPTPRMYKQMGAFSIDNADFTDNVNVYLHIPFCKCICTFCGYLKTMDSEKLRSRFMDALLKEIEMYAGVLGSKRIDTIHFGGGTPSLLTPAQIERVLLKLNDANPSALKTSREISIEATPESVELEKFEKYRELGINKVSIGVQSFNENEILFSKRHNTPTVSEIAIKTLQKAGIGNVVMDLMIGIEGQTIESFEYSLRRAMDLHPDTIELFALGIMPNTGIGKRLPNTLMKNPDIYKCYEFAQTTLLDSGYAQDCHNRYVIPGRGGYIQETNLFGGMSVLGFGAGARSYAKNMHYRNTEYPYNSMKSILEYMDNIEHGRNSVQSGIYLDRDERIRRYVIGNIESIDKPYFKNEFGIAFAELFREQYMEMFALGFIDEDANTIKLNRGGLIFRDLIARQFFSDTADRVENEYRKIRN